MVNFDNVRLAPLSLVVLILAYGLVEYNELSYRAVGALFDLACAHSFTQLFVKRFAVYREVALALLVASAVQKVLVLLLLAWLLQQLSTISSVDVFLA